ncbi:MAG: hypothetical protein GQ565_00700 [Candidatus Aegiribacteria sp.]|nr:hypothetical protein [Candidatus Aegiribacteria sp.]
MSNTNTLYELTGLEPDDLAEVLAENPRAYMAVKGAVAEKHLEKYLERAKATGSIRNFRKASGDFDKDFYLTSNTGSEVIVECKNVQVIPVTRKQVMKEFVIFCISKGWIQQNALLEHIISDYLPDQDASFECSLELLSCKNLESLLRFLPQEIRKSGLPRFQFSAEKMIIEDIGNTLPFLDQFDPPLKIDFQRTRNSTDGTGDTRVRRFYRVGEINVVAACLFSRSLKWEFVFGHESSLQIHPEFSDRYSNKLVIQPESWTADLSNVL